MNLEKLRGKIDLLDMKIVELLNERACVVQGIGEIKKVTNAKVYAPEREKQVYDKVVANNKGPLSDKCIMSIYRELMAGSIALEKPLKVAFLGPEGTFSYFAAKAKFGHAVEYVSLNGIDAVFQEVVKKRTDYGVVPVENSTEGGIRETLSLFTDCEVKVCAEIIMPIHHNLLANCTIDKIEKIYSKSQVFSQCKLWLSNNFKKVDLLEVGSTTEAVAIAVKEPNSAAIAHSEVNQLYGINTLRQKIEDSPHNVTRFFVLSSEFPPSTGRDKTSVMCYIKNEIGALYKILEPFRANKINLTDIEPLPTKKKVWDYCFYLDFMGHATDENVKKTLAEVNKKCVDLKIIGSFPEGYITE
ncbi:MAG: prephenate dehydratase [Candidatus Scalindua sp. AMX11]|nr:MAG: prephenate dehydratase [Candidatus Scalindua sp.]NOG82479.1 prephenate dehydratase [Planctomycetota bacterium]RZV93912.1 MAG: prephenate dehydratase [Candidatus Scalindua sp. SCAELEC01]TDE65533.1 MAG: prephenate dehydratase [Candidatus Scalindua sp. AMX11]GJQ58114.1 MAG: prephenate dehydratase [Candidatus Scalindua sp.]